MAGPVFDPRTANAKGVGGYAPISIGAMGADQTAGWNALKTYLTGNADAGTGPFAGFLQDFLAPLATAAINALAMKQGTFGKPGQYPTGVDEVFKNIANMTQDASAGNIYDYLGGLAQQAIGAKLGPGSNVSFDELQGLLKMLNPLTTTGMDPISASQYGRQQHDFLANAQTPSYWDPYTQNDRKDWGSFFTNSDFGKRYFNGGSPLGVPSAADQQRRNTPYQPSYLSGISAGGVGTGNK